MKIKNLFRKFHKSNTGVTLVELIIAVTVVSIAIGPLLYSFVVSTRFNGRSRQKQRASSAAQTVMENFKATDVEDIYKQFAGTYTDKDGNSVKFLRANAGAVYTYPSTGMYGTYTIDKMTLSDVTTKDTGLYSAVINVSEGRNDSSVPEIYVFDPQQDAIWMESESALGSYFYDPNYVVTDIINTTDFAMFDCDRDNISKIKITREMHLSISDGDVNIQYKYPYSISFNDGAAVSGTFSRPTRSCLTDKFAATEVRSLYFYYYPAYKDSRSINIGEEAATVQVLNDVLYIENTSSQADGFNMFVYKQIDSGKSFFSLSTSDRNYKLKCAPEGCTSTINLYDCIQKNLADIQNGTYSGESTYLFDYLSTYVENTNINMETDFGPTKSAVLTVNVSVTIYASSDTEHNDPLAKMTSTVVKK